MIVVCLILAVTLRPRLVRVMAKFPSKASVFVVLCVMSTGLVVFMTYHDIDLYTATGGGLEGFLGRTPRSGDQDGGGSDDYDLDFDDTHPDQDSEDDDDGNYDNQDVTSAPSSSEAPLPEGPRTEDSGGASGPRKMNVLFMMTDDMRPQLGAYAGEDFPMPYADNAKIFTPNLDALAESSILFKRAYVQYALCGPSRTSMLTSRRPDTTGIFGNNNYWRDVGGNFTTLPQHFKDNGYVTLGLGKIFHKDASSNNNDIAYSWSNGDYFMPEYTDSYHMPGAGERGAGWKAVSKEDARRYPLADEQTVIEAKDYLGRLSEKAKTGEQPFFMAVGFKKPHLSLICPEEFFRLYPVEKEARYLPDKQWQTPLVRDTVNLGEPQDDGPGKYIPDEALRDLRRAYSACISYVDSLVGKLVAELDRLGLSDNTIVSFVADHGYHLGENNHWGKRTTYERSTHVPLMIRIPGLTDDGIKTRSLVEVVDVFPTIVEAAGLEPVSRCPVPSNDVRVCSDGRSLLHLVRNPHSTHKMYVFSQTVSRLRYMVYSVRTGRYRFIERVHLALDEKRGFGPGVYDADLEWDMPEEETELYDLKQDPEERYNRTLDKKYFSVRRKLQKKLRSFVSRQYKHPKYFVESH